MLTIADRYGRTECRRIYEQVIHGLVAADNCGIESVSHDNQGDRYAQYEKKKKVIITSSNRVRTVLIDTVCPLGYPLVKWLKRRIRS